MAITRDSNTNGSSGIGTTLTFSFNNVGGNYVVVVADGGTNLDDVAGATYAGTTMSLLKKQAPGSVLGRYVYMFGLANPATGNNNVVISSTGASVFLGGLAASYSGVPTLTSGNAGGVQASITDSITIPSVGNCWAFLLCSSGDSGMTAGTGVNLNVGGAGGGTFIFDSNGNAPVGSYSMTGNQSVGSAELSDVAFIMKGTSIARDSTLADTNFSGAGDWTRSFNNVAGTYLVACVSGAIGGADTVTGVTYNGVAMTLIRKQAPGAATGNQQYLYSFGLAAPATGTHNLVISHSGSGFLGSCAATYSGTGVTVLNYPDNTSSNAGSSTNTITDSLTPVLASWTFLGVESEDGSNTAGAGSSLVCGSAGSGLWLFDSNAQVASGASYSMTANSSTSASICDVMVSIADVASTASNSNFLMFFPN